MEKARCNNFIKFLSKQKIISVLFIIIPIIFFILFTIIPFVSIIRNSFYSMTYTKNSGFVALENYKTMFENLSMQKAMINSLYYMIAAIVQVALALLLAVLTENSKYRTGFKAILFFPYLINGIAIGYMFRIFLSHGSILDSIIGLFGVSINNLPFWLRNQNINNWVLASISIWRYLGLSYVIFIGAISSVNRNYLKAAELDGANKFKQFIYIIWPSIKKVVLINLLLSMVSSLSEFEIPYAVASGGSNGTSTYMTLIYHIAFNERKIGLASAITVTLLCQIILICWVLVLIYKSISKIGERKYD